MDLDTEEISQTPGPLLKKYRLAGYGFLSLNIVYLVLALVFLPPFNAALTTIVTVVLFLALIVLLTVFILRCKRGLVRVLAVLYALRSLFAVYTLTTGGTFAAVPYFLPCLMITFYLLGRAGWDWP